LKGANFVNTCSKNTGRILMEDWGITAENIRLLYPGVDTARFTPAAREQGVRTQLGWGERPVVLTVARLQKRKGHDQMILALSAVRRAVPDVLYAIVGDGEERRSLEELVAREGLDGHVQFMGEIGLEDDRLVHCYQQCDLFVLPNREVDGDFEGFGMVLLEAQACGKAVVGGASGGTAETMRIPETGRIVSCDGPYELATVVVKLLRDFDLRARMGQAARRWVIDHFDWAVLSREAKQWFQQTSAHREPCVRMAPIRS
jgi:phosphatidylinositol alpha-1,6-mannosyltransferase